MAGVAAGGDGLAVLDADQHAAADGAVAAGGLDPGVGDAGGGGVAELGIDRVGVLLLAGVEAEEVEQAVDRFFEDFQWALSWLRKVSAMLSGTTETKKR